MTAPRRIVANLDCESDFARAAGLRRQAPSAAALAAIAGAGTLLRVFAREGDRLWLPAAVDPERVTGVPGLPDVVLENGPLADAPEVGEVLAWGETVEVARRRSTLGARASRPPRNAGETPALPALDRLPWRWPKPAPAAAAAVHDRRFCLAVAGDLGCRLPGARVVASPEELAEHLDAGGAGAATRGGWVLKAPFSAAGRWRHVQHGGAAVDRRRIEGLFRRHGELVFEPWMERTADFGCAAAVTPEGTSVLSHHRLRVDARGRFHGVELRVGDRGAAGAGLGDEEGDALARVVDGVGAALARAGYSGPFGVDAWRYRRADGREAFQPLGEINGRMTFGLVARALVERLRGRPGLDRKRRVRLTFGPERDRFAEAVVLLRAARGAEREIRLEVDPRREP